MSLKVVHISNGDALYEKVLKSMTKKAEDRAARRKELGNKVIGTYKRKNHAK